MVDLDSLEAEQGVQYDENYVDDGEAEDDTQITGQIFQTTV